ncbi:DNA polymerase delta subunit 3 [Rhinoderma darwinii]|uniref:DNA polymerase delta subunit 3 n=1 Tax=Rhinoderma darwinii TaxID=43563 RepID=UPI003F67E96A
MDELYLENIDELITDHNKIVTYKWLSHTLGVHVNQAKQMLYDYVTRKRKENLSAQVHVTYLLTGKCHQDGFPYHKVAVVKEEKLEAAKSKLAVVANVHVYSIQKATLKDSAPLFSADYDIIKNNLHNCNKFSAIQCPAAVLRSPEEVAQLNKSHSQQDEVVPISKTPPINGHASPPAAKPKGIMGMFSRQAPKSQESQKDTKTEAKEAAESSSKQSARSSAMSNFFGKASMSKIKESPTTNEPVVDEKAAAPQIPVPLPETKVKESEPPKAAAKNKKSKTKRVEMSDSDEERGKLAKKKRRRIKKPQPDSSDDEGAGPVASEVKTPSPPPPEPVVKMETEPEPQSQSGEKRRKRKRVLKSKTFLDDEGCMVTEKLYMSESCTDSGEEFTGTKPAAAKPSTARKPETKAEPKTAKKATAANKGTKQASIMGFFQKK